MEPPRYAGAVAAILLIEVITQNCAPLLIDISQFEELAPLLLVIPPAKAN